MAETAIRTEKSLVARASRLAGGIADTESFTVPTEVGKPLPSKDGYLRHSPVQPLYRHVNYYRKLVTKCVGVVLGIGALVAVIVAVVQAGLIRF